MNTDPVAFFREDYPALFNRGVASIRERADGGDDKSTARLADIEGARGAVHVVLDEGGEIWLTVEGGVMTVADGPGELPVRIAVGAPAAAARAALEEIESAELLDSDRAPYRVARLASAEVEGVLEGRALQFHVTLTDLPSDPDEVTIRIGLGVADPPADPQFSAKVSWDDIDEVREGEMTPQQLLGRLKISGDASQAMALGMTLMNRRR